MKKEKIILSFSICLIAFAIMIIFLTVVMDFMNITQYFSFTNNYDWLSIIGAIVGGLIGAVGTFLGIYFTLKSEQEENEKRQIEERKRDGYSHLIYSDEPLCITLSLDSRTSIGNIIEYYNVLVDEDTNIDYSYFCDIELSFVNMNNNYPSGAKINNMIIIYKEDVTKKERCYKELVDLKAYNPEYKFLTIKNQKNIAFITKCLIGEKLLESFKKDLRESKNIDIKADIEFINPYGVTTKGSFTANLIQEDVESLGEKEIIGSNKLKIKYKALNTYFIINEIGYCEDNISNWKSKDITMTEKN